MTPPDDQVNEATQLATRQNQPIAPYDEATAAAGQTANVYASQHAMADFTERKAKNTKLAHTADMDTFVEFLSDATNGESLLTAEQLLTQPEAWIGLTWGLVEAFKQWMLIEGYAIGTINRKLSTIRDYAREAEKSGLLNPNETRLILAVRGYSRNEGINVDQTRPKTRVSHKKARHVSLSTDQVRQLKNQPDTPQGRRDAIIIHLLAEHGLRLGELTALSTNAFNLKRSTFSFYREKVKKWQTHKMTPDTQSAITAWLDDGATALGPLLRASRRGPDNLTHAGMTDKGIAKRVRTLGRRIGIAGLSPHDLRHYWATNAAANNTHPDRLKQAGGWSSLAIVMRYIEESGIANEGVNLTT